MLYWYVKISKSSGFLYLTKNYIYSLACHNLPCEDILCFIRNCSGTMVLVSELCYVVLYTFNKQPLFCGFGLLYMYILSGDNKIIIIFITSVRETI